MIDRITIYENSERDVLVSYCELLYNLITQSRRYVPESDDGMIKQSNATINNIKLLANYLEYEFFVIDESETVLIENEMYDLVRNVYDEKVTYSIIEELFDNIYQTIYGERKLIFSFPV